MRKELLLFLMLLFLMILFLANACLPEISSLKGFLCDTNDDCAPYFLCISGVCADLDEKVSSKDATSEKLVDMIDSSLVEESRPKESITDKNNPLPEHLPQSCKVGERRSCYDHSKVSKEFRNEGKCKEGIQVCDKVGHWGKCLGNILPQKEICNGQDDDCDGKIDDITRPCYINSYKGCSKEKEKLICRGTCKAGSQKCKNSVWSICKGYQLPQKEVCDEQDNNCDGEIDNDITDLEICDGKDNNCDGNPDEGCHLPKNPYSMTSYGTSSISALAFDHEAKILLIGTDSELIQTYNLPAKAKLNLLFHGVRHLMDLHHSPKEKAFLVSSKQGRIAYVDYQNNRPNISFFEQITQGYNLILAYSPDGRNIIIGSLYDKTNHVYELSLHYPSQFSIVQKSFGSFVGLPRKVAFSMKSNLFAVASDDGKITLVEFNNGFAVLRSWQAHAGKICRLVFSSDDSRIISVGKDNTIASWKVADGTLFQNKQVVPKHFIIKQAIYNPAHVWLAIHLFDTNKKVSTIQFREINDITRIKPYTILSKVLVTSMAWKEPYFAFGSSNGKVHIYH